MSENESLRGIANGSSDQISEPSDIVSDIVAPTTKRQRLKTSNMPAQGKPIKDLRDSDQLLIQKPAGKEEKAVFSSDNLEDTGGGKAKNDSTGSEKDKSSGSSKKRKAGLLNTNLEDTQKDYTRLRKLVSSE